MSAMRTMSASITHLQLPMALSAVAMVESMTILIAGRSAGMVWLAASGLGTLGLYLVDGVSSSRHEDAVNQPLRAELCRRHRWWVLLVGMLSLLGASLLVALSSPSILTASLLGLVGLMGLTHVLPLIPRRGSWCTVKRLPFLKPFAISVAWLLGGLAVALHDLSPDAGVPWCRILGVTLVVAPLLLLDSIWLDRRDAPGDRMFSCSTIFARMSRRSFTVTRVVLFVCPAVGAWLMPGALIFTAASCAGASGLLLLTPDRVRSESMQVLMAAAWRFTGLVGLLFLCC